MYDDINISYHDSTYTLSTAFIFNIGFLHYLFLIITKYRFEKDKVRNIKKGDRRGDCLAKVDKEDLGDFTFTPSTTSCFGLAVPLN